MSSQHDSNRQQQDSQQTKVSSQAQPAQQLVEPNNQDHTQDTFHSLANNTTPVQAQTVQVDANVGEINAQEDAPGLGTAMVPPDVPDPAVNELAPLLSGLTNNAAPSHISLVPAATDDIAVPENA